MIMPAANRRRWFALALLCAASFMTVLDGSIVNVALPEIGRELHFSAGGLQWVVTGYALSFGGFLLLAGRAGDLLGHRRLFVAGLALFSLASLACGLAQSETQLILGRLAQGLGGALLSPAALALVATTFADGPERHRALGIYGGLAALGFATGVLLGGLLTDRLGWRAVFFVNLPVGALALALAPRLLEARRAPAAGGGINVIGAVIVTAALAALVYGVAGGAEAGPGAARTLAPLGLAALLAAGFVAHERRTPAPLVRLGIFRRRTLAGANLLGLVLPGTFVAALFLLTLYLQGALDYTPIRTGLAFLPMAAAVIVASTASARLVAPVGLRPLLTSGTGIMALGLLLLARLPAGGTYPRDLLPGMLVAALGFGVAMNTALTAAVAGVDDAEQGLAAGLFSTATQLGTALVVALLAAVAARTAGLAGGTPAATAGALTGGYAAAFATGAGVLAAAAVVAVLVIRRDDHAGARPGEGAPGDAAPDAPRAGEAVRAGYACIWVDDVPGAAAFYERAFGLRRRTLREGGPLGPYAELAAGALTLAIADRREAGALVPTGFGPDAAGQPSGAFQLTFITPDVGRAYTAALHAGATAHTPPTAGPQGQTIAHIRDPHGVVLAIVTPGGP